MGCQRLVPGDGAGHGVNGVEQRKVSECLLGQAPFRQVAAAQKQRGVSAESLGGGQAGRSFELSLEVVRMRVAKTRSEANSRNTSGACSRRNISRQRPCQRKWLT